MNYLHAIEVRYLPAQGNKGPRVRLTSLLHPANRRVVSVNGDALFVAFEWLCEHGMAPVSWAQTPRGWIVMCENKGRLP